MKSFFAATLLSLLPFAASAFEGTIHGRYYAPVGGECGISHVRLHVQGDNLRIDDFDVMFENGSTQDIPVRKRFRQGSYTEWKDLSGRKRCIQAFSVRARPDLDFHNARVTMYGLKQVNGRVYEVRLGTAKIRDFGWF